MGKKILVADDNKDIREIIVAALSPRGYEVVEAEDGEVAIEKLQSEPFDLLITDYDMPEANGIEVLEEAISLYPEMPVVFMSAMLPPEVKTRAEGLANHIMEKPFGVAELARVVSRLLG